MSYSRNVGHIMSKQCEYTTSVKLLPRLYMDTFTRKRGQHQPHHNINQFKPPNVLYRTEELDERTVIV